LVVKRVGKYFVKQTVDFQRGKSMILKLQDKIKKYKLKSDIEFFNLYSSKLREM